MPRPRASHDLILRRPRTRPALILAGLFVTFVTLAPVHAYVHADAPAACASCHLGRHSPALTTAPHVLGLAVAVASFVIAPPALRPSGVPALIRSRGPPF